MIALWKHFSFKAPPDMLNTTVCSQTSKQVHQRQQCLEDSMKRSHETGFSRTIQIIKQIESSHSKSPFWCHFQKNHLTPQTPNPKNQCFWCFCFVPHLFFLLHPTLILVYKANTQVVHVMVIEQSPCERHWLEKMCLGPSALSHLHLNSHISIALGVQWTCLVLVVNGTYCSHHVCHIQSVIPVMAKLSVTLTMDVVYCIHSVCHIHNHWCL